MKLDSWQAIADYLGSDIRTVARWERERGLPVYRGPAHRPNTVFAYAEELEDWLASHGKQLREEDAVPPPPPKAAVKPAAPKQVLEAEGEEDVTGRRLVVVLLSVLLIPTVVWAVWEVRFAPLALQSVTSQGRSIVALTTTGSVAWTYLPPSPLALPGAERFSDVGNLDGSPHPEVIAAPIGSYQAADRLFALSNRGSLLWEKSPR